MTRAVTSSFVTLVAVTVPRRARLTRLAAALPRVSTLSSFIFPCVPCRCSVRRSLVVKREADEERCSLAVGERAMVGRVSSSAPTSLFSPRSGSTKLVRTYPSEHSAHPRQPMPTVGLDFEDGSAGGPREGAEEPEEAEVPAVPHEAVDLPEQRCDWVLCLLSDLRPPPLLTLPSPLVRLARRVLRRPNSGAWVLRRLAPTASRKAAKGVGAVS